MRVPLPIQYEVRNGYLFANGVCLRSVRDMHEAISDNRFWVFDRWLLNIHLWGYTTDYFMQTTKKFLTALVREESLQHDLALIEIYGMLNQ